MDIQYWGEVAGALVAIAAAVAAIASWLKPSFISVKHRVTSLLDVPDRLTGIEGNQAKNHGRIEEIAVNVNILTSTTRARMDANPHEAYFECDTHGRWNSVNKTFLTWTNSRVEEVVNHGWINMIHFQDRERVRDEWDLAIGDSRTSSIACRLRDGSPIELTATPIPEGIIPCERWVGVIRKVFEGERRRQVVADH